MLPSSAPTVPPIAQTTPVFVPPPSGILEAFDLAAAIAQAPSGATIKVPPGTYTGPFTVTKAVRLKGAEMGQVFIVSQGRECLTVRAPKVAAENIEFRCDGIGNLPALSVAPGAGLNLEACKVQSSTALGVAASGALKAVGCSFTVASGAAVRLNTAAQGSLTQCSFSESQVALSIANGATADLHSCAFNRNGAEGKGSVVTATGAKASLAADDCRFTNNTAGIRVLDGATVRIDKCFFADNGVTPQEGAYLGLVVLFNGARGTLSNSTFESNRQGVTVVESKLTIDQCQFTGGGIEQSQILFCQPLGVDGKNAVATVRHSVITGSALYAVEAIAGGNAVLEDTEISGAGSVGLAVGDRGAGGARAEVRRCQFLHNRTGIGLVAGSSATIDVAEIRDNQDGIIALDPGTHLRAARLKVAGNTDAGIFVRSHGEGSISDSDFADNARGVIAGVRGKSAERATLSLENCRFGGSRYFGVGACAGSQVTLTNCAFDGTDKQKIFQERGAVLRKDDPRPLPPNESPSPNDTRPSPVPGESPSPSSSPSPESSASSSPRKKSHPPHRPPTRRPHPPTPEDLRRALHDLLPGN
jgi:parallel beta helix pectate lyase-like protein